MTASVRERELAIHLELHERVWSASEQELVQLAIDRAVELTDSRIGYLHFVNEDQRTIELAAWSRSTLAYCTAVFDRHYPIDAAGVWADTARLGRPVIHNDYQSLPDRRGYPAGHAHLLRHLGAPVIEGGKTRVLLGVGNRDAPYDSADAECLVRLGDVVWRLVAQRRRMDALLAAEARAVELEQIAAVAGWTWDPGEQRLRFDAIARVLLRLGPADALPSSLEELLARIDRADRPVIRTLLATPSSAQREFSVQVRVRRADGTAFLAAFKGRPVPRPRGSDMVIDGILQDLTEQQEFQKLRHLAFHDALTGLSNRQHLVERLERLRHDGRRRSDEQIAVHFIDLDLFKSVNDRLGHRLGDEVLKVVADRVVQVTRHDDLSVRMGGDEFVVIQFSVHVPSEAMALGRKVVDAIRRPIVVEDHSVQIGASVGVALGRTPLVDVSTLLTRADAALYRSKAAGGNVVTIHDDADSAEPPTDTLVRPRRSE